MTEADWIWAGLILAGAAFEAYALANGRPGDTLSESVRRWFRVRTSPGRLVFTVAWIAFTGWFLVHIAY